MSDEINVLRAMLNENLTVRDGEGREVLQVALLASMYFEEGHRRGLREAILACCEEFLRRFDANVLWALHPDTRQMERYGEGKGSTPREWLPQLSEDESVSLILHGARYERGAGCPSFRALARERLPYLQLGYLQVALPLLSLSEDPAAFSQLVLEFSRKIQPLSGYGGVSVLQSPDNGISHRWEPIVYRLAQRFPGLEADFPISHSNWLDHGRDGGKGGIKGVNWLTIVADRWLAELGGPEKVTSDVRALDRRFIVHAYEGGLMIQAGDRPEIGDAEQGRWPELYVKLSKYLKPLRITQHRPFGHAGPEPRFGNSMEPGLKWLQRFDDR